MTKQVLILAVSYKAGGSCVAGIDVDTFQWVRLVSTCDGGAINGQPLQCIFKKLNIYNVEVQPAQIDYQLENYLLVQILQISGEANVSYIKRIKSRLLCQDKYIFGNNDATLYQRDENSPSLVFCKVNDFKVYWDANATSKNKNRASFNYNNFTYTGIYVTEDKSYYKIGDAYLVMSLPKDTPFNKFVAAIY